MLRDNLQLKSSRNKFGNFHSALPVDLIDGADQKKRSSERPQAISIVRNPRGPFRPDIHWKQGLRILVPRRTFVKPHERIPQAGVNLLSKLRLNCHFCFAERRLSQNSLDPLQSARYEDPSRSLGVVSVTTGEPIEADLQLLVVPVPWIISSSN